MNMFVALKRFMRIFVNFCTLVLVHALTFPDPLRFPWHSLTVGTMYIGHNSLNHLSLHSSQSHRQQQTSVHRTNAQQYQPNLYISEKYFQCATIPLLTMWVYLHSFSHCCLPNMRSSAKFLENLNLQQFKVIQGHGPWCQSKVHTGMQLPISH